MTEQAFADSQPTIWVDADACPVPVKEIICKAAMRTKVTAVFVANQSVNLPPSPYLKLSIVSKGFDSADNKICEQAQAGDLCITQDIPLASDLLEKSCIVLHPRGDRYSPETIRARLTIRNFNETMRASGIHSKGPKAFSQQDKQAFANALDRWLRKAL